MASIFLVPCCSKSPIRKFQTKGKCKAMSPSQSMEEDRLPGSFKYVSDRTYVVPFCNENRTSTCYSQKIKQIHSQSGPICFCFSKGQLIFNLQFRCVPTAWLWRRLFGSAFRAGPRRTGSAFPSVGSGAEGIFGTFLADPHVNVMPRWANFVAKTKRSFFLLTKHKDKEADNEKSCWAIMGLDIWFLDVSATLWRQLACSCWRLILYFQAKCDEVGTVLWSHVHFVIMDPHHHHPLLHWRPLLGWPPSGLTPCQADCLTPFCHMTVSRNHMMVVTWR